MTDLRVIDGSASRQTDPTMQERVVELLEWALALAREGKITAVGLATLHSDGDAGTFAETKSTRDLIAPVAMLQQQLVQKSLEAPPTPEI